MTTPLVPFPIGAASAGDTPILTIEFGDWDENGWVKTGDNEIIDWWDDPASATTAYLHGNNGLGTWFDELPPARRDTQIARTFGTADGFLPNRRYRFVIEARWQLGTGADPDTFTGTEINGTRGSLSGPIFEAPTRTYEIIATATSAGNVEIKAMVENVPTSATWDANWYNIEVFLAADAGDLADIIINTAVVYVDGAALSITRGGASFDPQEEYEDYEVPGGCGPIEGLRELVSMRPVLRLTAMLTGETQIMAYRPTGTWGDHASIAGARTFTPAAIRAPLSSSVSLTSVYAVWRRARGDYIAVHFPKALCRRYGIHSRDKDEGELAVEIEALQDLSTEGATPKSTPFYYLHTLPAATTVEDLP